MYYQTCFLLLLFFLLFLHLCFFLFLPLLKVFLTDSAIFILFPCFVRLLCIFYFLFFLLNVKMQQNIKITQSLTQTKILHLQFNIGQKTTQLMAAHNNFVLPQLVRCSNATGRLLLQSNIFVLMFFALFIDQFRICKKIFVLIFFMLLQ